MSGFFDDQSITIPCPKCGHEHSKTIGWLKAHNQIPCNCGTNIRLEASDLFRKLEEVERRLDKIPRTITIKI